MLSISCSSSPPPPTRNTLAQGVLTEALNPKTALFFLFFLSFIPQFIAAGHGPAFLPFVLLGLISVSLNTAADIVVACFAGPIGQKLIASPRLRHRQRTASGIAMIGLGSYVAVSDSR